MAFSNPEVYLEELAEPLCRRFQEEPTSYDLAMASCIMLYHFADVVAHVRGATPGAMAAMIAKDIPKFHYIQAIANAAKHVELTKHPRDELVGLRAEHLVRGTGAAFDDGSFFSDGSTFEEMQDTVIVATPDGVKHDVLHLCTSVLNAIKANQEYFYV